MGWRACDLAAQDSTAPDAPNDGRDCLGLNGPDGGLRGAMRSVGVGQFWTARSAIRARRKPTLPVPSHRIVGNRFRIGASAEDGKSTDWGLGLMARLDPSGKWRVG